MKINDWDDPRGMTRIPLMMPGELVKRYSQRKGQSIIEFTQIIAVVVNEKYLGQDGMPVVSSEPCFDWQGTVSASNGRDFIHGGADARGKHDWVPATWLWNNERARWVGPAEEHEAPKPPEARKVTRRKKVASQLPSPPA